MKTLFLMTTGFSQLFFSSFPGPILQALPFVAAAGWIYWFVKFRKDKTTPLKKKTWQILFVCYLAGVVCMVFFYSSIRYFWGFLFRENKASNIFTVFLCERTANFVPDFYKRLNRERLLNVVLFLPFGILYPLAKNVDSWKKTVCTGLVSIVLIEVLQPVFARAFDVNDLILNTFGMLFSTTAFFLLRRIANHIKEKRQSAA